VDGERVLVEAKPLELLHELLLGAGNVIPKEELLRRIWPGLIVVEASLPTAVRKLRLALGAGKGDRTLIATIPGVGYQLGVPVEVEHSLRGESAATILPVLQPADHASSSTTGAVLAAHWRGFRATSWIAGGAAVLALIFALGLSLSSQFASSAAPSMVSQNEAANALRRLDVRAIEAMLGAGWSPNTPFDGQGTTAITYVLNMCEWDRSHDRRRMLLMVRTLYDAGGHIDRPNFWGDTAYSIAKAPRYCGPNHPVTEMIRTMCYSGAGAVGDRCLATYELARRSRR
jgi:DNA-binding winged helix-turn-helix (wHTH) protein